MPFEALGVLVDPGARVMFDLLPTSEIPGELLKEMRRFLDEAFDKDFSDDDWEHTLGGWHGVVMDGGAPVSHAAVVPRVIETGGRPFRTGYVEGAATAQRRRREGLASLVVGRLGPLIRREFELGALSTGAHGLYQRLGWERWRGPTFARRGDDRIRTVEDDDGLMVLRFGPSLDVDLGATISCEARSGDHW